jgi:hypothetical protein
MKRKKRGFIICGVDVEWDGNKIGIKKERGKKEKRVYWVWRRRMTRESIEDSKLLSYSSSLPAQQCKGLLCTNYKRHVAMFAFLNPRPNITTALFHFIFFLALFHFYLRNANITLSNTLF